MPFQTLKIIVSVIVAAIAVIVSGCSAPTAETKIDKPNIIFIFADDLGWGDISVHGHPDIRTPNIDRLAEEGSEFYQFSVSNPVCSPSRAAIMTGHYPARHSVNRHIFMPEFNETVGSGDWLDPSVVMLPRLLQQAGYKTGHFGKWHLGAMEGSPLPAAYGYDETAVFSGRGPQTDSVKLYDDTVSFIKRNKDTPFFINMWLHETHTPHLPTAEALAKYTHLNEQEQVYAAVVDDADQRIGKVLNALDDLGLTDNTLVIFSSDNGPEKTGGENRRFHTNESFFNNNGVPPGDMSQLSTYYSTGSSGGLRGGKRDLYQGGLTVPFLVRWPSKVPAGRVDTQSIVAAVDILPTLAEIGGAHLPADYRSDGQSVASLLKGGTVEREKPMFWEWRFRESENKNALLAVREGPWKLFVSRNGEVPQLYNVMTDRAETINLADKQPDRVRRMTALALEWKATLPETPPLSVLSQERLTQE